MSNSAAPKARPGRRWPSSAKLLTNGKIKLRNESTQTPEQRVYSQLREMILNSKLEPGEWLRQEQLAALFGVSRTPVREALRMLAQEQLVEFVKNHGVRVVPLSWEEFEELYALRIGLEGLAARLAAEQATDEDIASLREAFAHIEQLAQRGGLREYLREEWKFRLKCYAVLKRPRLLQKIKNLREHAERYLRLAYTVEGKVQESLDFHRRLLEAIANHNGAAAEQINQDALRWTLRNAGPIVRKLEESTTISR
ncbi:MAG: GntR family transcriptional regulator [Anaerolineae bacterium]|nr:GntR family transcriptional regulator [Thermoflexales bacterium]MDW8394885.1 GntR family transcriptional regulator [Anaerolineae bacterium]